MSRTVHRHAAFGAVWCADLPLPLFDAGDEAEAAAPVIEVRRVAALTAGRESGGVDDQGLRLAWHDEVTFDMIGGTRIDYLPGPRWTGEMPAAFYSTIAALTMAWRGALPCHASAVEWGGQAVLIAGDGGAGKSTLTAALLQEDATLIGDDLSVIGCGARAERFAVARGRPAMRLHPDTAASLSALSCEPIDGDDRGKWLVRPVARSPHRQVPLAGFIMLGAADGRLSGQSAALLLARHLFRPRWLRRLPGHADRLRTVFALAQRIPCFGIEAAGMFHHDRAAVARARRLVEAMTGG